jgi:hypothetical protein
MLRNLGIQAVAAEDGAWLGLLEMVAMANSHANLRFGTAVLAIVAAPATALRRHVLPPFGPRVLG